MLIDEGKIEIERTAGGGLKFTHRSADNTPRRSLEKQRFMSAAAWKQAIEDWLSNYAEEMLVTLPDGAVTTVGLYESRVT